MTEQSNIIHPKPRRPFDLTPYSSDASEPPTPQSEKLNPELLDSKYNGNVPPSRTRSLLNLTSSTLLGIYAPTGYEVTRDEPTTPWGTGAQTPSRKSGDEGRPQSLAAIEARSNSKALHRPHVGKVEIIWALFVRAVLLFAFGVAGGMIITHLHENDTLAPVKVRGIDRKSWYYAVFWGTCGVIMGNLLPWIDSKAKKTSETEETAALDPVSGDSEKETGPTTTSLGADWNPAVRGIGAFVGVAFAIRRLQWQSTMQASLTLGLLNPCLWYMLDRTKTGFALSSAVGIFGAAGLLAINPAMVPPPTTTATRPAFATGLSQRFGTDDFITDQSIAVATWVASVLFCSSVCFGNIGRRLAMNSPIKDA